MQFSEMAVPGADGKGDLGVPGMTFSKSCMALYMQIVMHGFSMQIYQCIYNIRLRAQLSEEIRHAVIGEG